MLTLNGITKRFGRRGSPVLGGVDLVAHPGQVTAILGRSGGGKTTLLRIIAGLEPPTAGSVTVDGADWTRLEPERRDVGLAFQTLVVHPHLDVQGNVRLAAEAGGRRGATGRAAVDRALAATGLDAGDLPGRRASDLSGGQLQRLALARMLARRPRVCLLDEPMTHLDPPARLELRELVRELAVADDADGADGAGRIVVMVTHDRFEAMRLGDRMAVLAEAPGAGAGGGSVVHQAGRPADLAADPATVAVADATGGEPINLVAAGDGHWRGFRPEQSSIAVVRAATRAATSGGPDGGFAGRTTEIRRMPGGWLWSVEPTGDLDGGDVGVGVAAGRPLRVLTTGPAPDPDQGSVGDPVRVGAETVWSFDVDGRRATGGAPGDQPA